MKNGRSIKIIMGVAVIIFLMLTFYLLPSEKYKVRDRWTYAIIAGDVKDVLTIEVIEAERNKVTVKETSEIIEGYGIYTYKKGHILRKEYNEKGELLYEDEYKGDPYFIFEFFTPSLEVGNTWRGKFEQKYTDENGTSEEYHYTFNGKIVGKEEIEVEAGKFEVYAIEIRGFENDTLYYIYEYWYSPEMRYNVKFKYTSGGGRCKFLAELKSFKLVG